MYIYIYIYIHTCTSIYIDIYIYICRSLEPRGGAADVHVKRQFVQIPSKRSKLECNAAADVHFKRRFVLFGATRGWRHPTPDSVRNII